MTHITRAARCDGRRRGPAGPRRDGPVRPADGRRRGRAHRAARHGDRSDRPERRGKTTLCDVITGLRRPVAGTVHLGGADLTGSAARERARRGIARTFQRPRRAGAATVRETVRAAAARHAMTRGYPGRTARDRWRFRWEARRDAAGRADALLARVGIEEYAGESARSAPPGVARLMDLARALATERPSCCWTSRGRTCPSGTPAPLRSCCATWRPRAHDPARRARAGAGAGRLRRPPRPGRRQGDRGGRACGGPRRPPGEGRLPGRAAVTRCRSTGGDAPAVAGPRPARR